MLPNSPQLLIRKGRYEEACGVLAALEDNGATASSASVRTQFSIIKDVLDNEYEALGYTWWQLLSVRGPAGVLQRMILGAWMHCINQISGINLTSYYMTYVFIHAIRLFEFSARILATAGSIDYLLLLHGQLFVLERYGRCRLMMSSATACTIC